MTTDDMKRELEANGWSVRHMVDGDNSPYEYWTITTPDGWEWETDARQHRGSWLTFEHSPELESEAVTKAYAHLQQQRELAALRALVISVSNVRFRHFPDYDELKFGRYVQAQAEDLIERFNITADESDET